MRVPTGADGNAKLGTQGLVDGHHDSLIMFNGTKFTVSIERLGLARLSRAMFQIQV
jgi:hypothetical protein